MPLLTRLKAGGGDGGEDDELQEDLNEAYRAFRTDCVSRDTLCQHTELPVSKETLNQCIVNEVGHPIARAFLCMDLLELHVLSKEAQGKMSLIEEEVKRKCPEEVIENFGKLVFQDA